MTRTTETSPVGIHPDVPEAIYHADRASLSQSGAKLLLPPSCPAKFRWAMDNPPKPKVEFDFGSLVHRVILGKGPEIVEINAPDYKTKAAQELRDLAREAGRIPALSKDLRRAVEMADIASDHPVAGPLLFTGGDAEVSLYADDPETGIRLRGRADLLTTGEAVGLGDRALIVDYKTAADANPKTWARAAFNWGYHIQFAWYVELVRLLELDDSPIFLQVCQEKDAPYLVSVNELDADAYKLGREQMQQAIGLYAACVEMDEWPGYSDIINPISLPAWAFKSNQPTIGELVEIN